MTRIQVQTAPDFVTVLGILFVATVLIGVTVLALGVVGA